MMRSLRSRLTLLATALTAVLLLVAGLLLLHLVRVNLYRSVNDTARTQLRAVERLTGDSSRIDPATFGAEADTVIQIVDPSGAVLASSSNATGRPAIFGAAGGRTIGLRDAGTLPVLNSADSYRVASLRAPNGLRLYVAVASDDVRATLHRVTVGLAVVLPLLVLVLGLVIWVFVGRALGAVEGLRRQAATISAGDPTQRLAPPGTDELARLAETLNGLLDRLDAASRRQREFVADAAHELRSPLAALRAQLEVGADPHVDDAARQRRLLVGEVDRMTQLTDDLLQLARLDGAPGTRPRQPVDLDDLVFAEVARLRGTTAVSIDVSGVSAARLVGDPEALRRLVRNLLDNAAHHARSGVVVNLRGDDDGATLAVADDGPGVAVADRERIFERFTRLDGGRGRASGGFGLGLAIVREVAEAHAGTVTIEDAGPGARFVVRLPVEKGAQSAAR